MKRSHKWLIVLGILVIIGVTNLVPYIREERRKQRAAKMMEQMMPGEMGKMGKFGKLGKTGDVPKVWIEAYYPFYGYHLEIKEFVESFAAKYPGKVMVEAIDFRTDEGYERWRKSGLSCGGVFINGKTAFVIKVDGKEKAVEFLHAWRDAGGKWTKEELAAAVREEIRRVYKE